MSSAAESNNNGEALQPGAERAVVRPVHAHDLAHANWSRVSPKLIKRLKSKFWGPHSSVEQNRYDPTDPVNKAYERRMKKFMKPKVTNGPYAALHCWVAVVLKVSSSGEVLLDSFKNRPQTLTYVLEDEHYQEGNFQQARAVDGFLVPGTARNCFLGSAGDLRDTPKDPAHPERSNLTMADAKRVAQMAMVPFNKTGESTAIDYRLSATAALIHLLDNLSMLECLKYIQFYPTFKEANKVRNILFAGMKEGEKKAKAVSRKYFKVEGAYNDKVEADPEFPTTKEGKTLAAEMQRLEVQQKDQAGILDASMVAAIEARLGEFLPQWASRCKEWTMDKVMERMGTDPDAKYQVITARLPVTSRDQLPPHKRPAYKYGDNAKFWKDQTKRPAWAMGMTKDLAETTARKPRNYNVYIEKKNKLPNGKVVRKIEAEDAFMYQKGPDGRDMLPDGTLIATHVKLGSCPDVGPAGMYRPFQPAWTVVYMMPDPSWRALTSGGSRAEDTVDNDNDEGETDSEEEGEESEMTQRLRAAHKAGKSKMQQMGEESRKAVDKDASDGGARTNADPYSQGYSGGFSGAGGDAGAGAGAGFSSMSKRLEETNRKLAAATADSDDDDDADGVPSGGEEPAVDAEDVQVNMLVGEDDHDEDEDMLTAPSSAVSTRSMRRKRTRGDDGDGDDDDVPKRKASKGRKVRKKKKRRTRSDTIAE